MSTQLFSGASKSSTSILSPLERRMVVIILPKIPSWIETYHLTLLTLVWCALIILFGALATSDRQWLWGVSCSVVLQYITDFLDGKVGKYRNTGLVKWGFYMDHLLDYVFLSSLIICYALILPAESRLHLLAILAIFGGFMVNSFLDFAATGKFSISHLKMGPTEFRIAIVIINTLLILFGYSSTVKSLPFVVAGSLVALCIIVYRTQKRIWKIDLEHRSFIDES